jgi:hypothetical protein
MKFPFSQITYTLYKMLFLLIYIDFSLSQWESQLTNNELHLTKKEFVLQIIPY